MKTFLSALASTAALLLVVATPALASTVTFDDLPGDDSAISNGYQGLNWSNFASQSNTLFSSSYGITGTGYDVAAVSGSNYAINEFGNPASFSVATGTLKFESAYFTSAYDPNQQITVTGLLNGTQLYSKSFTVSDTAPSQVTFDWSGINDVTVTPIDNGAGAYVALDDVSVSAVPLPGGLPLFASAVAGLIAVARRGRRPARTV